MSGETYFDGVLTERWDDATRTYTDYRTDPDTTRPYTDEENADADVSQAERAQLTLAERVASIEAMVVGSLPPPEPGAEPTFEELTSSQNGAVYAGQRFVWTDGQVWEATTGPLNASATPETYPQGYRLVDPPANIEPWAAGVAYAVNDAVSYDGNRWTCTQAHTSQVGWEPPAVPALWRDDGEVG
jgi:hypothetical protein